MPHPSSELVQVEQRNFCMQQYPHFADPHGKNDCDVYEVAQTPELSRHADEESPTTRPRVISFNEPVEQEATNNTGGTAIGSQRTHTSEATSVNNRPTSTRSSGTSNNDVRNIQSTKSYQTGTSYAVMGHSENLRNFARPESSLGVSKESLGDEEEFPPVANRGRSMSEEESIMGGVQRRIRYSEEIADIAAQTDDTSNGKSQGKSLPVSFWPPTTRENINSQKTLQVNAERKVEGGLGVSLVSVMVALVFSQSVTIAGCLMYAVETVVAAAIEEEPESLRNLLPKVRATCIPLCAILCGLGVIASGLVGIFVQRQFDRIGYQLDTLEESTIAATTRQHNEAQRVHPRWSRINSARQLQARVKQLTQNLEVLPRFLPATVVRAIVRGDETALRLHVKSREVTIMFSDVADFTTITESLAPTDMMFLLTRYLSVMSHIVEMFGGIVAEICGDGLLVFWNTPDDVDDHAAKAVASALAQQKALAPLNEELSRARLQIPDLRTRIGISTGRVHTGNIGSENKMKWGCMGDCVNLASRLEGLNKVYGTTVMCEGATRDAMSHHKFFLRKLDLVQVKGKTRATLIYEVKGLENDDEDFISEDDARLQDKQNSSTNLSRVVNQAMKASDSSMERSWAFVKVPQSFLRLRTSRTSDREASLASSSCSSPSIARRSSEKSVSKDTTERSQSPYLKSEKPGESSLGSLQNCLSDGVTAEAMRQVLQYEEALEAFQAGRFVESKEKCVALLEDCPEDTATKVLLGRTSRYVGEDGKTIALTEQEKAEWSGLHVMDHK